MQATRRKPAHQGVERSRHDRSWPEPHTLWKSFLAGIADLTLFAHPAERIPFPHADEADALRSDWIKIGQDMGRVFERQQHASTKEEA